MRSLHNFVKRFLPAALLLLAPPALFAQLQERFHTRGLLWENEVNDGWIGSFGAWDYGTPNPLGMYPGFKGYVHPVGGEKYAWGAWVNANFHDFRSGCWIVVKNMKIPAAPPTYTPTAVDYEMFYAGLQAAAYGTTNTLPEPELTENFVEKPGYQPGLPEETITCSWNTNTGITVTRRSSTWSFPGYRDFVLYDYVFKNTGKIVSVLTGDLVPNPPDELKNQTLNNVFFVFHSGISVSTKSQINFHNDNGWKGVAAGGFGWEQPSYHDKYWQYDNGTLVFSTNANGGSAPLYSVEALGGQNYDKKDPSEWKARFGDELQSPAAFGWLALYATNTGPGERSSPKPDVLRIDSHKGGSFGGGVLDLQAFVPGTMKKFYDFANTPDSQAALGNNGDRMNFYTFSYGPYRLLPGDSVRFVLAEIAGVMDYAEVNAGDPLHHFPDSTIAAIRRNAAHARDAVKWGIGGSVNGIPVAADVPEPPPPPGTIAINTSAGIDTPIISVIWDKLAETTVINDGSGAPFYNGLADLDGYRVYRSTDFQFVSDEEPPVLRGATWTLLKDIPKADFSKYEFTYKGEQKYHFLDTNVTFGFRYGYYVSAYRSHPRSWTSVNGSVVPDLPELESGSTNRTDPASPFPGPTPSMDVFVVPNPYVYGDAVRSFGTGNPFRMEFRNLPENCTIRIYTIAGDLVRVLEHQPDALGNLSGSEAWDQKSDSGLLVAPGLYVYHVQSNTAGLDKAKTGKLMIIR